MTWSRFSSDSSLHNHQLSVSQEYGAGRCNTSPTRKNRSLAVCNSGPLICFSQWPVKIFREQVGRWLIYNADITLLVSSAFDIRHQFHENKYGTLINIYWTRKKYLKMINVHCLCFLEWMHSAQSIIILNENVTVNVTQQQRLPSTWTKTSLKTLADGAD